MKRFSSAVSVILLVTLLGLASQAQKSEQPAQKPGKVKTGEVVSVDATKNEIVLKDASGKEDHLQIAASTKITREGKVISLADIKGGDQITCECEESSDGCKATVIQVIAKPAQ